MYSFIVCTWYPIAVFYKCERPIKILFSLLFLSSLTVLSSCSYLYSFEEFVTEGVDSMFKKDVSRELPAKPQRLSRGVSKRVKASSVPVIIPVDSYKAAVRYGASLPPLRLVKVYTKSISNRTPLPQYRLFEVHPKGPFGILGLKNGDVLYGAHDRAILNPNNFLLYPKALLVDKKSTISFIRESKALKLVVSLQ